MVTSIYSNTLTTTNPTYSPPHQPTPGHYFDTIQLTVTTFGTYTIRSTSGLNLYGYLYINSFDPANPSSNLIGSDDDTGGNQQFQFQVQLQSTSGSSKRNHPSFQRDYPIKKCETLFYCRCNIYISGNII